MYKIREATGDDRQSIVDLYRLSQEITGIPDPAIALPDQLEDLFYSRSAVNRYVACYGETIVGHGLVEYLSPADNDMYQHYLDEQQVRNARAIGGAFVHPEYLRKGIYTKLFEHRLSAVKEVPALPLAATWRANEHVCRIFERLGGSRIATHGIGKLAVHLYIFE